MSKEIEKLSFEEAMIELEKTVKQLESGSSDLKTSIDSFERGIALKKHCEARLQEAQSRIEKITLSESGKVSVEEFRLSE